MGSGESVIALQTRATTLLHNGVSSECGKAKEFRNTVKTGMALTQNNNQAPCKLMHTIRKDDSLTLIA